MKTIIKTILYLQMTAMLMSVALADPGKAKKQLPFRGFMQAVETWDVQFPKLFVDGTGTGKATHLGRFTAIYEAEVDLLTASGSGSVYFVAANGDGLSTEVTGQAYPTEDPDLSFIEEAYTITGGTGRFAGATGSFTSVRLLNTVTGVTFGLFEGTIVIQKGK